MGSTTLFRKAAENLACLFRIWQQRHNSLTRDVKQVPRMCFLLWGRCHAQVQWLVMACCEKREPAAVT